MTGHTLEQGSRIVKAARSCIELQIRSPHFNSKIVEEGIEEVDSPDIVAIRIVHFPTNTQRGFFIEQGQTGNAVKNAISAALTAAFKGDIPIVEKELDESVIELHLLAEPVPVTGSYISRLSGFELGKNGVVIEYGNHRSMLLPVHAKEKGLDKRKFLEEACKAAGLPANYWMQPKVKLFKFDTQTFAEESPSGKIVER